MIKLKSVLAVLLAASFAIPAGAAAPAQEISRAAADYTGSGSVVAVIAAGFSADHPAFAEAPSAPALSAEDVAAVLPQAYLSEKLPAVWDYAAGDADVYNTSFSGTAAASLAAGRVTGKGDILHEDGTVTHDPSFAGSAPDAQLLLFKAAADNNVRIEADAAVRALRDAIRLGADAILLSTEDLECTTALRAALRSAKGEGIPVFAAAGNTDTVLDKLPVTYTDHGTLTAWANVEGIVAVGAAADPYSGISSFTLRGADFEEELSYTDSCEDYFGAPFASLAAGLSLPLVFVPGMGRAEDYAGLDVRGKAAVIARGEITFAEKANFAAEAGAEVFIVIDNGSGVSRMALEEAKIPGVMLDTASGERLRSAPAGTVMEIEARSARPAVFSSSGITDTLEGNVAFLCAGDGVKAAIPSATLMNGALWASVRGTFYAAANAAGFAARAAEYCRLSGADVLSALASSAIPVTDDEDGTRLSVRRVGAGLITDSGTYAAAAMLAEDGSTVTLPGTLKYTTAYMNITLQNQTRQTQKITLRAEVSRDGYTAAEGDTPLFSGKSVAADGVQLHLGDSISNIIDVPTGKITLAPGQKITLALRLRVPQNVLRELSAVFENGFFLDGILIAADETGAESVHPFTVFCGDWSAAPLADATVYDTADAVLGQTRLLLRKFNSDVSSVRPLGALNPNRSDTAYDQAANLVNPASLRLGWVELELHPLRGIDQLTATFRDAQGHIVYVCEKENIQKYLRDGKASIPLWDFIAVDNRDYLFPDGEYSCEVRLSSSFGQAGEKVQMMHFTFTVDSAKPRINDLSAWKDEKGRTYLTVQASDNTALYDIAVYDTLYTYRPADGGSTLLTTLKDSAVVTFDVTSYDGRSPLYIEVTDRTDGYATVRISPAQFEALLEAQGAS